MNNDNPALRRGPALRVLDGLANACMLIAGLQMVTLIAIFGWLVYGRYILNDTPTWVEQLALLLVVWITFLGGAASVWTSSHLSIDFVREMMPDYIRIPLRFLALLGMIFFGVFLARQGWGLAETMWARRIPMLGIAEGWRAVPMSVCGVLTVIFSIAQLVILARNRGQFGE